MIAFSRIHFLWLIRSGNRANVMIDFKMIVFADEARQRRV